MDLKPKTTVHFGGINYDYYRFYHVGTFHPDHFSGTLQTLYQRSYRVRLVEEYRECEVVESRYDGSHEVWVVTVKTADGQLWDMLDREDYWRTGDRLVACFDRYEDTGVTELNAVVTDKY